VVHTVGYTRLKEIIEQDLGRALYSNPHAADFKGREANGGKEFHLAAHKSATRVASILFLDGLAPKNHYGRAAHMASRGYAPGCSSFTSASLSTTLTTTRAMSSFCGQPAE